MPALAYRFVPSVGKWRYPGRPDLTPPSPTTPTPPPPGTRPARANTGWVSAGSPALSTYSPLTVPAGTTLTGRYFPGDVTLSSNVTLVGCVCEGQVKARAVSNVVIRQCDAQGFVIDGTQTAELDRVYTTGAIGVDGVQVKADGGTVPTGVWVHHSYIGNAKVNASSHYDGLQVRGVNGLTIEDCYFDGSGAGVDPSLWHRQNAAIFLENANGGNANVTIRRNHLRAMGYGTLSIAVTTPLVVESNVFYPSGLSGGIVKALTGTIGSQTGNTWDSGATITNLATA